jgi:lipid-A-disaccharide synthase
MRQEPLSFFLSAGETSGDRLGADLVEEIRRLVPDAEFQGVGGPLMAAAGCEMHHDMTQMAVMWWLDVFRNLPAFWRIFHRTAHTVRQRRPHLLVPIDYPGFNLRLADRARQSGVPVLYFISPQVWAWWRWRVHLIAERVDRMAVVLPFEEEIYRQVGLPVDYVGHPVVDRLKDFKADPALFGNLRLHHRALLQGRDSSFRSSPASIGGSPAVQVSGKGLVGLLPGSRRREVAANLPMMCLAARKLSAAVPGLRFVAAFPDERLFKAGQAILDEYLPDALALQGHAHDLMAEASFCFVCAGSATLELAWFDTPMAVVYRIRPKDWVLAKLLMAVEHIGLVNIVAGRRVVPEFLTVRDASDAMARAAQNLIEPSAARQTCKAGLAEVREKLGPPGAVARTASIAVEMAEKERNRRQHFNE